MIKGVEKLFNKEIKNVHCEEQSLTFNFTDETRFEFFDDGQSCCETRYMNTDDCLSDFKGAKFVNAEVRDGPQEKSSNEYGDPADIQFLIVTTTKGQFTVVNYNEHNGYYAGFGLILKEVT